ncbi:uncharacterized protein Z519_06880 [Cladophialophora bantiana CBS 173.52]|uniref:Uncharacterized protein n=1 Tax=Cladophialophora bantiana (strain ATCC 10958 / CBS 173.52 / CDC B-1940 / NIH 8579) TaxID=1442370 RepID=A0A0D2ET40_CLAB1|nr:uncharacterized protein Z519_06880 [Cladophialophora bantiana CBS 173.52]KIW93031.1 hypothetical protein Z519_06880 [Cladophialophora bantiana CBS 173.52]
MSSRSRHRRRQIRESSSSADPSSRIVKLLITVLSLKTDRVSSEELEEARLSESLGGVSVAWGSDQITPEEGEEQSLCLSRLAQSSKLEVEEILVSASMGSKGETASERVDFRESSVLVLLHGRGFVLAVSPFFARIVFCIDIAIFFKVAIGATHCLIPQTPVDFSDEVELVDIDIVNI